MRLQEAIALLKSEGYRVTKSRPKAGKKGRVGPTFVAAFADGEVTRMSTFTSLAALDLGRGVRLARAAWQSRHRHNQRWPAALRDAFMRMRYNSIMSPDRLDAFFARKIDATPPAIVAAHFEQDDVTLASFTPDQLEAA